MMSRSEAINLTDKPVIRGGHGLFQTLHREQEQVVRLVAALQLAAHHAELVVPEPQSGP